MGECGFIYSCVCSGRRGGYAPSSLVEFYKGACSPFVYTIAPEKKPEGAKQWHGTRSAALGLSEIKQSFSSLEQSLLFACKTGQHMLTLVTFFPPQAPADPFARHRLSLHQEPACIVINLPSLQTT